MKTSKKTTKPFEQFFTSASPNKTDIIDTYIHNIINFISQMDAHDFTQH